MFRFEEFMGRRVLKSSLLDGYNVDAFFTTRDLPLKAGERDEMIDEVERNKKLICEGLNIPCENLFIPQQTHSSNIGIISSASPFTLHPSPFQNTDALITNEANIALGLNFADCTPLIFYDPINKVAASAHAGWRGTEAKIGVKTVEMMRETFGSAPKDIIALIGPAIGQCCFEVGDEVKERLLKTADEKYHAEVCKENHIDLKLLNKIQLLAIGVEKIDVCEYCTSCKNELFYSYRKEKGHTARHSAVIMINGENQ